MSQDPASAHPYDRHVGRYGQELADGLIEFAELSRGDRVLDVGCGTGQLTMRLADVVGGARVAAVDISAAAAAVCRERIPDADVRVASAETLPFPADRFDLVLAQLVVNLVADPRAAVQEMTRVATPGAVVAACFWDDDEMPLLRSYWDAARACAPHAFAQIDDQAQVGVANVGVLRDWWLAAGLHDVQLGRFEVAAEYEGFEDLWSPFEAGVGHSGRLYVSLAAEEQQAVRADARRRLGSPSGPFRLTATVRAVRGRK